MKWAARGDAGRPRAARGGAGRRGAARHGAVRRTLNSFNDVKLKRSVIVSYCICTKHENGTRLCTEHSRLNKRLLYFYPIEKRKSKFPVSFYFPPPLSHLGVLRGVARLRHRCGGVGWEGTGPSGESVRAQATPDFPNVRNDATVAYGTRFASLQKTLVLR